jgi:restriction system protein
MLALSPSGNFMRRRRESNAELLLKLPWWVSAALGVLAFIGLRWGLPIWAGNDQFKRSFIVAFVGFAPAILLLFAIFAAGSFWFGRHRRRLLDQQTSLDSIRALTWKQFEFLVAEAYRRQGYQVEYSLGRGADGGVDLTLRRDSRTSLVQCKQWKVFSVGAPVIREMFGLLHDQRADEAIIVTTGKFTRDAQGFAAGKPIQLIDGPQLLVLVQSVQGCNDDTLTSGIATNAAPSAPEEIEDIEVDADAATKVANLQKIERELAQAAPPPPPVNPAELERQRRATEEAQKKKREDDAQLAKERERQAAEATEKRKREEAERLAQEKERQAAEEVRRKEREAAERVENERRRIAAAEAAENKRIENERLAKIRAEQAKQRRKAMAKVAKVGGIFVVVAALGAGGYFGWNKAKIQLQENAFNKAVGQANADFKSGDFSAAISAAEKALAIHKGYSTMQKLIADANDQIKIHESYGGSMKNGQTAFDSRDYSNAVTWAVAALQKMPSDLAATKLQEKAQQFLDDYHNAVNRANAAHKNSDFAGANAEADKALAIYKNDLPMQQLKADAQRQIANQQAYQDAMKNAQAAFDGRDFTNALAMANEALRKFPGEQTATRMRDSAQKYLNDYHDAMNSATAAYKNSDFAAAEADANKALAVYPKDAAMQQLKTNAQTQAKLRADYTKAFNNAQTAFDGRDYTNSAAWATEALKQIPNEPNATALRDKAQKHLNDYHEAVDAANAAWQKSDFAKAVTEADKALAVYPKDAAMQQLKTNAQGQIANQLAYHDAMNKAQAAFDNHDYTSAVTWATTALEKIHGDAAATKIKSSAQQLLNIFRDTASQAQTAFRQGDYSGALTSVDKTLAIRKDDAVMQKLRTDILRQLDSNLVILLESFNVSVPPEIKYAEVKKASTLGAIGDTGKPYYESQADKLEKTYRAGNWLNEGNRQTSLHDLRKAIDSWE